MATRTRERLDAVIDRAGIDPDDLAAVITAHLGDASRSKATLSSADRAFLDEFGGVKASPPATASVGLGAVGEMAALLAESLTGVEVARGLGIDAASVRDRKRNGSLYALRCATENRYPRWQFTGGPGAMRVLPGLRDVLNALAPGIHPLEVHDFFTVSRGWLRLRDRPMSVAEWLASGGELGPVLAAARAVRVAG